jgi:hypothetical protein
MDVEVSHQQLVGTDPVIIIVREIAEEETQKRRRLHFLKRKAAPSSPSSPPPKRNSRFREASTTTHDDDSPAAIISDVSPSQDQSRRRTSSVVAGFAAIKRLFNRKDSHQVESFVPERRTVSPDQDDYRESVANGMSTFSNVSGYFTLFGPSGPSNFYETPSWGTYQSSRNPNRANSSSVDPFSSTARTPTSPAPTKARTADTSIAQSGSPEPSSWRMDLIRRKPKKMSEKALGKRPDLSPEREVPQTMPEKNRGEDKQRPTTLPLTFDAPRPTSGHPPATSPSRDRHPQPSTPKRISIRFVTPSPEHTPMSSQDCGTSFPDPCHPQPQRTRIHQILTGRPDEDEHYLEAGDASYYDPRKRSTPPRRQASPRASAFTDIASIEPTPTQHDPIYHGDVTPTPLQRTRPLPPLPNPFTRIPSLPPQRPSSRGLDPSSWFSSRSHAHTSMDDESMSTDDQFTTPLLPNSRPNLLLSITCPNAPLGHHILSRSDSNEQMTFPMSPCGSRTDLVERSSEGTWPEEHTRAGRLALDMERRRGSKALPEGVVVEQGFGQVETSVGYEDSSDEEEERGRSRWPSYLSAAVLEDGWLSWSR